MLHFARYACQVRVDTIRSFHGYAGEHIADHETQRVILPIFSGTESVDTFHHVLTTHHPCECMRIHGLVNSFAMRQPVGELGF